MDGNWLVYAKYKYGTCFMLYKWTYGLHLWPFYFEDRTGTMVFKHVWNLKEYADIWCIWLKSNDIY